MDREQRTTWTDARLDDFARDVLERLRDLADTGKRLAVIDTDLTGLREDVGDCRNAIQSLSDTFSKRAEARERERKDRERERKVDRRWLIGTVFTAAGIVIAAAAVLVQVVS